MHGVVVRRGEARQKLSQFRPLQSETVHRIDNEMQQTGNLDSTDFRRLHLGPGLNSLDCPGCVLSNQFVRIGCCPFQRRQVCQATDVAQGDTDIAEETASFDPLDGGIPEQRAKFRLVQFQIIPQQ
jgi:hypothetical protein